MLAKVFYRPAQARPRFAYSRLLMVAPAHRLPTPGFIESPALPSRRSIEEG
jgi:hypothetical protein